MKTGELKTELNYITQGLSYLEKLVNLGQINSLFGIKFVNIAAVSIHKVQAKPHDLRHS